MSELKRVYELLDIADAVFVNPTQILFGEHRGEDGKIDRISIVFFEGDKKTIVSLSQTGTTATIDALKQMLSQWQADDEAGPFVGGVQ